MLHLAALQRRLHRVQVGGGRIQPLLPGAPLRLDGSPIGAQGALQQRKLLTQRLTLCLQRSRTRRRPLLRLSPALHDSGQLALHALCLLLSSRHAPLQLLLHARPAGVRRKGCLPEPICDCCDACAQGLCAP